MWLGSTDADEEGTFFWVSSGKSLNFTNWREGEPNNNRRNEDCVEMAFDTGRWNDVGCNWQIFSTMCELILENGQGYIQSF
jgi:hypothetical protein